jgi:hypothetical protein
MASEERANLPARLTLDRAALDRVLGRAAELAMTSSDNLESLTEERVIQIGKEVGISEQHLRQALAEERTRLVVPDEPGVIAQYFGPGRASSTRTVRGTPEAVLRRLDQWMQDEECLQVKRRFPDRITWDARRDLVGNIKRGFNLGGRGYALTRASEVGATVVLVDADRTLVRLDADLEPPRRATVAWTSVTAGFSTLGGAAAAGLAMIANVPLALAAVGGGMIALGGFAGAAVIAKAHQKLVARAQLALDQVLDQIEHGAVPPAKPRLLDQISSVVKVIR